MDERREGSGREERREKGRMEEVGRIASLARSLGLEVHAGHGLDYHNVQPIVEIKEISELSIGFAIVARAAMVGMSQAVKEMLALVTG